MGVSGNPMQQSMSPRHTGPLSPPVRTSVSRTNVVPPASPQLQTSRTTPQYPAPQASPHMHQAGSMSPSGRLPSYSPKQQMGPGFANQSPVAPAFKTNQALRAATPRNEASTRGYMSSSRLMSPPPSSMQAPNMTLNQTSRLPMSYNGDNSMQQYFNQPNRFPQSWQGTRQQTPSNQNIQAASGSMLQSSRVPRPNRYGVPQQVQQQSSLSYRGQSMQISHSGYQPMQNMPTSVNTNQQSRPVLPNPPTSLSMPAQNDFDADFNLDSLLNDPSDGIGSFMQQLQDVAPAISSSNLTTPQALPPVPGSSAMTSINTMTDQRNNQPSITLAAQTVLPAVGPTAPALPPASVNATPGKSVDSSSFPILPRQNAPLNRENNKLDSGEITLESTEQDLLKAASSLPTSYPEATLPPPGSTLLNEIKELNVPLSVSQASTPVTSSSISMQSAMPTPTQPSMSLANAATFTSSGSGPMFETNSMRTLSRDSSMEVGVSTSAAPASSPLTKPQLVTTSTLMSSSAGPAVSVAALPSSMAAMVVGDQVGLEQRPPATSAPVDQTETTVVSLPHSVATAITSESSSQSIVSMSSTAPITTAPAIQTTTVASSYPIPTPVIQPSQVSTVSPFTGPVSKAAAVPPAPYSSEFPPNLRARPPSVSGPYQPSLSAPQAVAQSSVPGLYPGGVPVSNSGQPVMSSQPSHPPDPRLPKPVGETPGYPSRPSMMVRKYCWLFCFFIQFTTDQRCYHLIINDDVINSQYFEVAVATV